MHIYFFSGPLDAENQVDSNSDFQRAKSYSFVGDSYASCMLLWRLQQTTLYLVGSLSEMCQR